jgi:hypothetical protein
MPFGTRRQAIETMPQGRVQTREQEINHEKSNRTHRGVLSGRVGCFFFDRDGGRRTHHADERNEDPSDPNDNYAQHRTRPGNDRTAEPVMR